MKLRSFLLAVAIASASVTVAHQASADVPNLFGDDFDGGSDQLSRTVGPSDYSSGFKKTSEDSGVDEYVKKTRSSFFSSAVSSAKSFVSKAFKKVVAFFGF